MPAELSESRRKAHSGASPGRRCVYSGIFSVLTHVGTAESRKLRKSRVAQAMPPVRYTLPGALSPWETRSQSPHGLCPVPALPPTSSSAASWRGCHASPLDHCKVMNWTSEHSSPPASWHPHLKPHQASRAPTTALYSRGTRLFHSKLLPCLPVHLTPGQLLVGAGGGLLMFLPVLAAGRRSVIAG